MILFFDRSMGTKIPLALRSLPNFPHEVQYHDEHFPMEALDPEWMPTVGAWGWTVIGHDYSYDKNELELAALRDYNIGAFYLWGSEASRWETLRVFANAFDKIVQADTVTPRPFVYRVQKRGNLVEVPLPL